jgi:CMP-N-acetylneuraminic acid synthetase
MVMEIHDNVVALIPAKMTSKRCPNKNMATLMNRPLIYFSIKVAQLVNAVNEIYVSSENEAVLIAARKLSAKTIKRPNHLSLPTITTQEVLRNAYEHLAKNEGFIPDIVLLLQPTHPFRNAADVQEAIEEFSKNTDYDSLLSVKKTDELRGKIHQGRFVSEFPLPRDKKKEPEMYTNTGSFYLFRPKRSFLTASFFGDRIFPYVLNRSTIDIDIDYPEDLETARCLLQTYADRYPQFFGGETGSVK